MFTVLQGHVAMGCADYAVHGHAALLALGVFLLHAASMVIAFEGWSNGNNALKAIPPALHLAVALLVRLQAITPLCPFTCTSLHSR